MMDKAKESEFEDLVVRNKSAIYAVCYMFASEREEADDLFQEILIRLWKGLPSFRADSSESTWIYRVSLNTCISYRRKNKRRREAVHVELALGFYEQEERENPQMSQLRARIQALPPLDRAIVLMWLESLPYDEIGAIAGISAKAVGVRLVRIRERLKRMSAAQGR